MTGWLATILIFLPLGGAVFVWVLPVGRFAGPTALLVALAEIGFWINAVSGTILLAQDATTTRWLSPT